MPVGDKAWARRIEQRLAEGHEVPAIARRFAEDVLGRQLLRGRVSRRPDAADRQAGDDSFRDDERYVQL